MLQPIKFVVLKFLLPQLLLNKGDSTKMAVNRLSKYDPMPPENTYDEKSNKLVNKHRKSCIFYRSFTLIV